MHQIALAHGRHSRRLFVADGLRRTTSSRCARRACSSRPARPGRTRTTATQRPARFSRSSTDAPWPRSVQARVFDPIGMTDSSPVFTPEALSTAALGYQWRDNDRPRSLHPAACRRRPPSTSSIRPARCCRRPKTWRATCASISTADARRTATQLIARRDVCCDDRRPTASTNGKPAGSPGVELGRSAGVLPTVRISGLSIFDEGGDRVIGHTGGISGYTACMQMNLTRGFGVIAMANLVEAPLHPCAIVLYAMRVLRAAEPRASRSRPHRLRARSALASSDAADLRRNLRWLERLVAAGQGGRRPAIAYRCRQDDRALPARQRHLLGRRPEVRNVSCWPSAATPIEQVVDITYGSQW